MVPTFPGSWTPSSTRKRVPGKVSGKARSGCRQRKRTPWGVSVVERLFKRSAGTCTSRTPLGTEQGRLPSWTTVVSTAPALRASSNSLGPSQTKSPWSRRADRALFNFRICPTSGLERLVICSTGPSPLP